MRKLTVSTLTVLISILFLNACGMPGPLYQTEKPKNNEIDAQKSTQTPSTSDNGNVKAQEDR